MAIAERNGESRHNDMARYLYSELARLVEARANCLEKRDKCNPNAVSASVPMEENEWHSCDRWASSHEDRITELVKEHMPSGAGFNAGTTLDLDRSHADKLVFHTSFHHMNEAGYYEGWTEHTVTVTPSLVGHFHMRISGRNRNDIKEYIYERFHFALTPDLGTDGE